MSEPLLPLTTLSEGQRPMIHLLVDTSVWLDLAKRRDSQKWIVAVRVLMFQKKLELLVPAVVLDEFEQLLQSILPTDFVTASPGRPPSLPPPPPIHVQPLESREFM